MKPAGYSAAVFCICVVIGRSMCLAQETATPHPLQPSDTSSPRATLTSFVDACNELYEILKAEEQRDGFMSNVLSAAERILDCLDLSGLPSELRDSSGVESGVFLKEVLDRIELPQDEEIPGATTADSEPVSRWRESGRSPKVCGPAHRR